MSVRVSITRNISDKDCPTSQLGLSVKSPPRDVVVRSRGYKETGYCRFFAERRTGFFLAVFLVLDFLFALAGFLLRSFISPTFFVVRETASTAAAPLFESASAAESATALIPALAATTI